MRPVKRMKREIKPNPHRTTDLQVDFDRAFPFPSFPPPLTSPPPNERTGVTRAALGLSDFREVGGGGGGGGGGRRRREGGEGKPRVATTMMAAAVEPLSDRRDRSWVRFASSMGNYCVIMRAKKESMDVGIIYTRWMPSAMRSEQVNAKNLPSSRVPSRLLAFDFLSY